MSQILIINNSLDEAESEIIESKNVLFDFIKIRKTHPQARIYSGNPCPENDVTPNANDKIGIQKIIDLKDNCIIVCYPGAAVARIAIGLISGFVSLFLPQAPKIDSGSNSNVNGSSNNNLSAPENKQRIKERIPYIIGRVKAIPDLYAPPYRYFKDGIEVEELLLCVSENPVKISQFKEGDTLISEITGKSVTAYGLNQNITGLENIYKVGDTFTDPPLIAKQNNSIDGQTLLAPNDTKVSRSDIYFVYPNQIKTLGSTSDFNEFVVNDNIIIEGANYGISDLVVTGTTTIDYINKTLSIASSQTIPEYQGYRKINISAMLIADPVNGQLDLAGLYDIETISYSGGVYTLNLINPDNTNINFSKITENATTNVSVRLTSNISNIFLDGEYTVTSVSTSEKLITLATPSSANSDWQKLQDLIGKQTTPKDILLRGSQENFIGWYTLESQQAEGLLLNFRAANGIYRGNSSQSVSIEAQYQQVVNGNPVGVIRSQLITLVGKRNDRTPIGGSMRIALPFTGAVRFRARRTNDNGDHADLVDETKFHQAFVYSVLKKLEYPNRVLVRARTIATINATSQKSRQLNCIAESLIYTYKSGSRSESRTTSRNLANITIDLALNPLIGRRTLSEIDIDRINSAYDDVVAYFGSKKMGEFNWTLDNTNTSFEELMRTIAFATGTHDRRSNRKLYYDLESADNDPIILFNHRNKLSLSESRGQQLRNKNDGIEITYIDSENGWVEKTIKVPNEQITKAKKIDGTGIVYTQQAHIVAWREWNKLLFSRESSTFTAYCESDLVFRGDCVLNSDDTRTGSTSSGEILAWVGLDIVGSQPFYFTDEHVIHLQMKSGGIDAIEVSSGVDEYTFKLSRAPREELITEGEVKTLYTITSKSKESSERFLVASKNPKGIFENELTLSKLDERFYRNDRDIINGII